MGDHVRVRSNRDGAPALASSTSMCSEAKRRDVTSWQPPLPTASHAISERLNPRNASACCRAALRRSPRSTQRISGFRVPLRRGAPHGWATYLVGLDDFSGFRRRDSRRSIPRKPTLHPPACSAVPEVAGSFCGTQPNWKRGRSSSLTGDGDRDGLLARVLQLSTTQWGQARTARPADTTMVPTGPVAADADDLCSVAPAYSISGLKSLRYRLVFVPAIMKMPSPR